MAIGGIAVTNHSGRTVHRRMLPGLFIASFSSTLLGAVLGTLVALFLLGGADWLTGSMAGALLFLPLALLLRRIRFF